MCVQFGVLALLSSFLISNTSANNMLDGITGRSCSFHASHSTSAARLLEPRQQRRRSCRVLALGKYGSSFCYSNLSGISGKYSGEVQAAKARCCCCYSSKKMCLCECVSAKGTLQQLKYSTNNSSSINTESRKCAKASYFVWQQHKQIVKALMLVLA